MMRTIKALVVFVLLWPGLVLAESFTIAAASDLRFALDELVEIYKQDNPSHNVTVIYGSSGRMTTQIVNGAPYDIFFSADISFPSCCRHKG